MLTPIDIQQKSFKGGVGYNKADVETFMSNVLESYEHLYKENMELSERVKTLNSSLVQYKTLEKSLQKALILAQKAAEDVKESARLSAKATKEEADMKAHNIISEAKKELDLLHNKTLALANQYNVYKAQYRQLAKAQLDIIDGDSFNIDIDKINKFIETEAIAIADEEIPIPDNMSNDFFDDIKDNTSDTASGDSDISSNNPDFNNDDKYYTLISEALAEENADK